MALEQTSLERFLKNRGTKLLSVSSYTRLAFNVQFGLGVFFVIFSLILAVCGVLVKDQSASFGLLAGSIGPLLGGVANMVVPLSLRKKFKGTVSPDLRMTPEARTFLGGLAKQMMGWNQSWYDETSTAPQIKPSKKNRGKSPKETLNAELFDLLERASYQYNRVCGILESAGSGSPVSKLANPSQFGADEAMFALLHQAAMISRYPESSSAAVNASETRIRSLAELSDRLEALQNRTPSLSDRLGYTSAMDSVLEELRLDDLARSELTIRPNDSQEIRE